MLEHANMVPSKNPGLVIDTSRDVIAGAQGVLVPPSPGFLNGNFGQTNSVPGSPTLPTHKQAQTVSQDRTGSGIKKAKTKSKTPVWKLRNAAASSSAQKSFRFLQLPGGKSTRYPKSTQTLTVGRNPQSGLRICLE
jgi:hypothetical protein